MTEMSIYNPHIAREGMRSQSQKEHAIQAHHLLLLFGSADALAEFLHQNYRAEAKSFKVPGPKSHDHGWCDCYGKGKKYFLRRAQWLLSDSPKFNGRL